MAGLWPSFVFIILYLKPPKASDSSVREDQGHEAHPDAIAFNGPPPRSRGHGVRPALRGCFQVTGAPAAARFGLKAQKSSGASSRRLATEPARVQTMLSRRVMPRSLPASARRFVTSRSSRLGEGSPDGWLCATDDSAGTQKHGRLEDLARMHERGGCRSDRDDLKGDRTMASIEIDRREMLARIIRDRAPHESRDVAGRPDRADHALAAPDIADRDLPDDVNLVGSPDAMTSPCVLGPAFGAASLTRPG